MTRDAPYPWPPAPRITAAAATQRLERCSAKLDALEVHIQRMLVSYAPSAPVYPGPRGRPPPQPLRERCGYCEHETTGDTCGHCGAPRPGNHEPIEPAAWRIHLKTIDELRADAGLAPLRKESR